MGYKSPLFQDGKVPFGLDFVDIIIPFNEFSSNWDEGPGTFVRIYFYLCSDDGNNVLTTYYF